MAHRSSSRAPRASAPPIAVDVRTDGVRLGARLEALVRDRVQRRLARRAGSIDRAHVRLVDVNGPRGGLDVECRIELLLQGAPRVFVRKRAGSPPAAFSRALAAAQVALQRAVNGRGPGARGVEERVAREGRGVAPDGRVGSGSLIGRREGRATSNLLRAADRPEKRRRDVPVDTAEPGRSATDRRAGYGSTARRNTKLRAPKAAVMLEDSMQARPSRKSTRRSAGRNRPDNPLYLSKRQGLQAR